MPQAILREGVTPIHRKSFAPIKAALAMDQGRKTQDEDKRRERSGRKCR